eukprot:3721684-Karenia_brevis.AAC.1
MLLQLELEYSHAISTLTTLLVQDVSVRSGDSNLEQLSKPEEVRLAVRTVISRSLQTINLSSRV